MSPLTMLILTGLPGSGKSTYASHFESDGWVRINQDILGSRDACLSLAAKTLSQGKNVIIDRCNTTKEQRAHWIRLALDYGADIQGVYLSCDMEECIYRIHHRKDHPTIKEEIPLEKKREIVVQFWKQLELPLLEEGFSSIMFKRN